MTAGFQSFTEFGARTQITSEMRHPAMIQSGRFNGPGGMAPLLEVGHAYHNASNPLLLLRPDPGAWVGGVVQWQDRFWVHASGGCDYALFSNEHPGIEWGGGAGIQIFDEQGRLTFSSAYRFPRIKSVVQCTFSDSQQEFGTGTGADEFGRRAWINANELTFAKRTGSGVFAFAYCAEMPNAGSSVIVRWRDPFEWFVVPFADMHFYDLYASRPLRIPMCHVPGV
jgi:hypothetical protein